MAVVRHEAVIDGSRDLIFDYVNGYQNVPEYMFGVKKFEPLTEVTSGLGSRFAVSIDAGPKTLKSVVECTEWVAGELIALVAVEGFKADTTWRFADVDGGTAVNVEFAYQLPGGLAGKALGAIIGPFANQAVRHTDSKIAAHVAAQRG
ncbi:SRPBCC family protein [Gordonia sp. ABSL1-1]|uniref:SRPBCC family protein n=1 Tax=Gordonia sp. ABSL1-1 TaxID=3053923 RepID=UPI0025731DCB|nr:SRPBCC family protein [Gordonia sp. ABSL1-1]MDL9937997.1 SRPBCC family protein [Gordonia sp. ABSL1-1]